VVDTSMQNSCLEDSVVLRYVNGERCEQPLFSLSSQATKHTVFCISLQPRRRSRRKGEEGREGRRKLHMGLHKM
jgi:hypothetical protein